jgi:hypothetical protein
VIFSLDHKKAQEPIFYYFVTSDIKNGFELKELSCYSDLRKVSYGLISFTEYQHRTINDFDLVPQAIGDKTGKHLSYKDFSYDDFILAQIRYRIRLKFESAEVPRNVDIEKEIIKIIANTVRIYGYKNFSEAELFNLATKNRTILNRVAIMEQPTD